MIREQTFEELNRRYLMAEVTRVRATLENFFCNADDVQKVTTGESSPEPSAILREMDLPPALETVCTIFELSRFEKDILLLCAGMELDSAFAGAIEKPGYNQPSFSLALAALPEAHWSALAPESPLRFWRMVEHTGDLTYGPLKIDESILHYLAGLNYYDERLTGYFRPVSPAGTMVDSHQNIVNQVLAVYQRDSGRTGATIFQFYGNDTESQLEIASAVCNALGLNLSEMDVRAIPNEPGEIDSLARLWERQSALTRGALVLDCSEVESVDKASENRIYRFIENVHSFLFVCSHERIRLPGRVSVGFEVIRPTPTEQLAFWQQCLAGTADLNGTLESLVSQFDLNTGAIRNIIKEVMTLSGQDGDFGAVLWETCRAHTRRRMDELARRIHSDVTWGDLVLPEMQKQTLAEIAAQVRQRLKVYCTWGFASLISRGLGINALFTGPSGTGKTMAAEILANELRLDLYRIDLSQVVSKYIGETEKNLRKVFDAAEAGGAILLFDEADALFGKRSEVKDSHDRYANIEVSYLLQRMEDYRGLAILTTNMKEALDTAFLRRLRFIVQFPFPNPEQRKKIWLEIFPKEAPKQNLDFEKLARLNVSGGSIRNIALYAAFLAAEVNEPVNMKHLLRAARAEYGKLETSLTDSEIKGWV